MPLSNYAVAISVLERVLPIVRAARIELYNGDARSPKSQAELDIEHVLAEAQRDDHIWQKEQEIKK